MTPTDERKSTWERRFDERIGAAWLEFRLRLAEVLAAALDEERDLDDILVEGPAGQPLRLWIEDGDIELQHGRRIWSPPNPDRKLSSFPTLLPDTASRAPCPANALAIELPSPPLAPVTSAVIPDKSNINGSPSPAPRYPRS